MRYEDICDLLLHGILPRNMFHFSFAGKTRCAFDYRGYAIETIVTQKGKERRKGSYNCKAICCSYINYIYITLSLKGVIIPYFMF